MTVLSSDERRTSAGRALIPKPGIPVLPDTLNAWIPAGYPRKGRYTVTNLSCTFESDLNCLCYAPLTESSCAVVGCDGNCPEHLILPPFAPDGRAVTVIGDAAFSGCTSVRTVTFPDSVRSIGVRSFAFCENLTEIRFGTNSRLSDIRDRAFIGCDHLLTLHLDHLRNLRWIGRSAYAFSTRLQSIRLPDSLTELAPALFEGCRALREVHLPASLHVIHTAAFSTCLSLRQVELPDHLRFIESNAFMQCENLSEVHLPGSTCLISADAFRFCDALPDIFQTES